MRSLLLVVILLAVTLSTSFVSFPMKQVDAQRLDLDDTLSQFNNCFIGDFIADCINIASLLFAQSGFPVVQGSGTIHQTQLNECTGSEDPSDPTLCTNTAVTELFLSALDQASIELNSKQLTEQTNTCITGASCENTGSFLSEFFLPENEVIRIVSEDQANVKTDTVQETFQDNVCEGAIAECINAGFDAIDIFVTDQATVEADSQQLLQQGNDCDNAFCLNSIGVNGLTVFAGGEASDETASVEAKANQDLDQGNECQDNAFSTNGFGLNDLLVFSDDQASVETKTDQELTEQNSCEDLDTLCQNNGENEVLIDAGGTSNVNSVSDQTIDTNNECQGGAQCTTDLVNSFSIEAQDRDVNSDIKQTAKANNNCEGEGVSCTAGATNTVNIVGGTGATPISTEQSTIISNTVEESNTGEYNVEQNSEQENKCTGEGTSCNTAADSTVNIGENNGSHDVKQNTQQTNQCDGGANCGNSASSTVTIGDSSDSSSPDSADASADNNEEAEPSDVEASISAATSSDTGDSSRSNDETGDNVDKEEEVEDNSGDTNNDQQSDDTVSNESTSEEPSGDDSDNSEDGDTSDDNGNNEESGNEEGDTEE